MTQGEVQGLPAGTQIAVYEIKEVIHRDSSGITYRAWNRHLNSTVTIAEYLPSMHTVRHADNVTVAPKSEADKALFDAGLAIFIEQSEILLGIQHPGIVETHNVLNFNGTAYCVMDDNKGILLTQWFETSTATSQEKLTKLLRALLQSLQQLHENGTAHGDIHANNIFISKNNASVLINFAVTRLAIAAINDTLQQELRSGYAAPELYHRDNPADAASDLYALGALMYAGITHVDPVSALVRRKALKSNQPDPLRPCADLKIAEFDENFLTAIDAMLSLDRFKRPQSVQEVLVLLDKDAEASQAAHHIDQNSPSEKNSKLLHTSFWGGAIIIVATIVIIFWPDKTDKQSAITPTITQPPIAEVKQQVINDADSEIDTQQAHSTASNADEQADSIIATQDMEYPSPATATPEKAPDLTSEIVKKKTELQSQKTTPHTKELLTEGTIETQVKSHIAAKTVATKQLIEQHLSSAEKNITALRLSTPPGDNAYYHYQEILKIQPDNAAAQAGLKHLVKIYVWFIDNAIKKKQYQLARIYLNRAEKILPDAEDLNRLRTALK